MKTVIKFFQLLLTALLLMKTPGIYAQKTDTLNYDYHTIQDSATAFKSKSSAKATIMCIFPIFNNDSNEGRLMNSQLKKLFDIPLNVSFENGLKINQKKYLKDYTDEMKDNEGEDSPAFDFMNTTEITVDYNKKGFVIIASEMYDYSGGAHGNGNISYSAYDLQQQKELALKDIITADSITLQNIVEHQFRKDYKLSATDSLNSVLFENHLPANNNFYFNNEGIGFSYNPYEVAAYANGVIDVFIPYQEIKTYLASPFKKRMQIK